MTIQSLISHTVPRILTLGGIAWLAVAAADRTSPSHVAVSEGVFLTTASWEATADDVEYARQVWTTPQPEMPNQERVYSWNDADE
jgi:hypothetical protein